MRKRKTTTAAEVVGDALSRKPQVNPALVKALKRNRDLLPVQDEIHALACDMPLIEQRLFRAGLYATAQVMREAVRRMGYEIEEITGNKKESKGARKK